MGNKSIVLIVIGIILGILAIDFVITAGLVALICWAFSIAFSWKLAIGIFCIMLLVSGVVSSARSNK